MDTINSGINNSNKMKTYAEGNTNYISPNIGNNRGNDKNITVKADTETMDFSDVDVDSILAEEDPFAVETNHISSKPIYGTTLGTEIKFSKGYSNVYDAANNNNSLNLNSSIIFDGTSKINKFKALDNNGNLVDLHIDVVKNMNIDDIMYLVSKEAKKLGIDYDKIVVNVVDENNNSRAWVKASDILLESQLIKEVNESTSNIVKNNTGTSNQVDTSLPHNISDANDIETFFNNNDTNTASSNIASSSNNAFESIKKTASTVVGKIGGFLSGVAAAQMESAKASAKTREQISKSTTSTIQTAVKTGLENLSKVGTNINKIDKENLSFYENSGNFVDTLSSDAIAMSSDFKSFMTESNELLSNAQDWLVNDALPVIENVSSIVSNTLERTGATVGTAVVSLVEGIGKLGEAIVDAGATILTGAASIVTLVVDGGGYLYSNITGKEWNSVTTAMWDTTKAFVAKKHVANWFDSLYENSAAGKWLKTNAFFFNNVREVSSGIGYTVGIIGLTLLTGGVGGIAGGTAGVAGIAGVGKGAEDAWGKGASTLGGLASGTLNGLWEGFQFFIGAKINGINIFGKSAPTVKTKLANSLIHVVLDGIDGGAEGFARTLIDTCYKDGYTDDNGNYVKYTNADSILKKLQENFDDLGGFNTVLTGAISGMATSAISEAFDFSKYLANSKNHEIISLNEQKKQFMDKIEASASDNSLKQFELSEKQLEIINEIEEKIRKDGYYVEDRFKNTSELTSTMLEKLKEDDMLDKVSFYVPGGFVDVNGELRPKYKSKQKYIDRVTYSGNELLPIVYKVEELTDMVDMSLSTVERAKQIHEIIRGRYSYAFDTLNGNGIEVSQSLRGITSNNKLGHEGLVCAGYSQLYKELCTRCGIKCDYIVGNAYNQSGNILGRHAWNVIFDDAGNCIPVDVTWDVSAPPFAYFGRSDRFAMEHIAESDEMFKDYAPIKEVAEAAVDNLKNIPSSLSEIFQKLDNVISTNDLKYGKGVGEAGLLYYLGTGDSSHITRTGGCRSLVENLDKINIQRYLASNSKIYQHQLIEECENFMKGYNDSYPFDVIIKNFVNGHENFVTRKNNYRELFQYIPKSSLLEYIKNRKM